jgi:hypothetical protein
MMFLLIVTIASMVLAALMSVIAWRIAAEERRRSEARVAALAAEIHAPAVKAARVAAFQQRSSGRWDEDLPIRPVVEERATGHDLFAARRSGSRIGVVVAFGVLVVAGAIAATVALERGLPFGASAASAPAAAVASTPSQTAAPSPTAPAAPLELVALGHDRDGDRLTVRGMVRNPSTGAAVDQLTAVVLVFNTDDGFLTTGRAIIDASSLRPGGESTFVVVVPDAARVGRYRVSFRSGDRIVPHVDRRETPRATS